MNSKHIFDLTVRLSQALDQNYDVVNMETVLSVISSLEGTTITKEQLEATRLAKYINQLRRRTNNEHLARRAKSLLKRWREMVGIQQQANEQATSSSNTATATSNDLHMRSTNAVATSSLTKSANINVHNSFNKRHEILDVAQNFDSATVAAAAASTAPISTTKGCKQPPTSFANLLTGLNETTYVIDQSSNSNSETATAATKSSLCNSGAIRSSCIVPIVIDIQDSNSCTNLITPLETTTTNITSTKTLTPSTFSPSMTSFKTKKSRKEKKRKGHAVGGVNNQNITTLFHNNPMVVIDERSTNQEPRQTLANIEDSQKCMSMTEEKSCHPMSNISEILSLSNSSMNSMFPGDVAARVSIDEKQKQRSNLSVCNRAHSASATVTIPSSNLSSSDLTFSGKFKYENINDALRTGQNNVDFLGSLPVTNRTQSPNTFVTLATSTSSMKINVQNNALKRFRPFSDRDGGGCCNSNDSTTNSRASDYDVIDIVNQNTNQIKAMDGMSLKHKQDTNNKSYMQQQHERQQQQQHKSIADNSILPQVSLSISLKHAVGIDIGDTNATPAGLLVDKKIPKKRGRKKGSKGVDSVIAKETSLSSQMLITSLGSGGKKVKTTKELYADIQNRKLGFASTTNSSPTLTNWVSQLQLPSHPESSCSEPSLQSPRMLDVCLTTTMSTVATRSTPDKYLNNLRADDSDSCTLTSEPSRDSLSAPRDRIAERALSTESNSNSQFLQTVAYKKSESKQRLLTPTVHAAATIEMQLRELLKQMPAMPTIKDIEKECTTELVPCSCKITEEISPQTNYAEQSSCEKKETNTTCNFDMKVQDEKQPQPALLEIKKESDITKKKLNEITTKSMLPLPKAKLQSEKPKKSIFDLDFDDDEDPLHLLMAETASAAGYTQPETNQCSEFNNIVSTTFTVVTEAPANECTHTRSQQQEQQTMQFDQTPAVIFPIYIIEEDPNCVAKERFEIQTQKIATFHINALHNCYIPNVNGNWDNADKTPTQNRLATFTAGENYISSFASVVPKYGSLASEHICKDLSAVYFTPTFKPKTKTRVMEKRYSMPFLGVAKTFIQRHTNHKPKGENAAIVATSAVNRKIENEVYTECKQIITTEDLVNPKQEDIIDGMTDVEAAIENNFTLSLPVEICLSDIINAKTTKIVGNNNNILKDITIDIADGNNLKSPAHNEIIPNHNLLVIYDNLNNTETNRQTQNCNKSGANNEIENAMQIKTEQMINKNQNESCIDTFKELIDIGEMPIESDKSQTSLVNLVIPSEVVKTGETKTSRCSSSCSNSSLKQTQQSINLKLRRRRLHKMQQRCEMTTVSGKRNRLESTPYSEILTEKKTKKSRIKRIKIAINGNIATQRQISIGSSNNNSSDDDQNERERDKVSCTAHQRDCNEENSNNSLGSCYSQLSHNTNIDLYNTDQPTNDDDGKEDEAVDEDEEFDGDDEEDYRGDYHEVVTRDISAPSSGNNHIVLTIKKTPSKTNSPSNSLSAMSPVINTTTNATTSTTGVVITHITSDTTGNHGTVTKALPFKAANMEKNTEIILKDRVQVLNETTHKEKDNKQIQMIQKSVVMDEHKAFLSNIIGVQSTVVNKISAANVPLKLRTQRKRKRKQRRCCNNDNENTVMAISSKKMHHHLFFPYELCICGGNSVKENILNISSCSSCCEDDRSNDDDTDRQTPNIGYDQCAVDFHNDNNSIMPAVHDIDTPCNTLLSPIDDNSCASSIVNSNRSNSHENSCNAITENDDTILNLDSNDAVQTNSTHLLSTENNGLLSSFNNIFFASNQVKKFNAVVTTAFDESNCDDGFYNATHEELQQQQQHVQLKQQKLPNENCDDYNNVYNNNFNFIKYASNNNYNNIGRQENYDSCKNNNINNSSNSNVTSHVVFGSGKEQRQLKTETIIAATTMLSAVGATDLTETNKLCSANNAVAQKNEQPQFIPHKEYRTGLRAVDEDVDDDDGNNCARIQQFKEWHQVLQLRSYNNELLTVLPYVVLE